MGTMLCWHDQAWDPHDMRPMPESVISGTETSVVTLLECRPIELIDSKYTHHYNNGNVRVYDLPARYGWA